ncbi:hypothetical protein [Pararhodospirillum photometricum]|uniref:hypothetical protein n=1 Tax=Pararhodospirillum photometricum TaxID=1084 RepID=UPI00031CFA2B|nr:hypothetical protein [Pararhodospirillum photometricum]
MKPIKEKISKKAENKTSCQEPQKRRSPESSSNELDDDLNFGITHAGFALTCLPHKKQTLKFGAEKMDALPS